MSVIEESLKAWVKTQGFEPRAWTPLPCDAGFRRYHRFEDLTGNSRIAVYAPPQTEANQAFGDLSELMREARVYAPEVYARDLNQGFWILSDLGTDRYDRKLLAEPASAKHYYQFALQALKKFQSLPERQSYSWSLYDAKLLQTEMNLFVDWFLKQYVRDHLSRSVDTEPFSGTNASSWKALSDSLIAAVSAQPQVLVHRDFQSRNLLWLGEDRVPPQVGILDFQDAVIGPVTYDVVSLLWDCYLDWPPEQRLNWANMAYDVLNLDAQVSTWSRAEFLKGLHWMGLQRHLKNVGIFARLFLRDGKSEYLNHIPRTLQYVSDFAAYFPESQWLAGWLKASGLLGMPL